MAIKSILFNTEMVRAILDGRKTCTRRIVKPQPTAHYGAQCIKPPYQPGDILYVRETWCEYGDLNDSDQIIDGTEKYYYRADGENPTPYSYFLVQRNGYDEHRDYPVWHPSIHMPKEVARIWLKVTDVSVERLQKIDEDGVWNEGFRFTPPCLTRVSADGHTCDLDGPCASHVKYCDMTMGELFGMELWDKTIKKSDLDRYGWNANPWVWVIEFERCEKPEGV